MKLSISNLSWDYKDNDIAFNTIKENGINLVEGVLTKIDSWDNLSNYKLLKYKELLDDNNINIKSIQSIFFGIKDVGLHDTEKILSHLKKIIDYCKIIDSNILVLGSPSIRKKFDGWEIKVRHTFSEIDRLLSDSDITLVIEPNSKKYGGGYFYTVSEIVDFIDKNKYVKIKTMIDTHNSILEDSNPLFELDDYFNFINHIHVSEIDLLPIKELNFHKNFSNKVKEKKFNGIITYELMKPSNLFENIRTFKNIYGN
jgi:sugar phosphate isomerase/epimerase